MAEIYGSYVWGLDGSPGTIISDYVVFALCLVYCMCTFQLYKSAKCEITRMKASLQASLLSSKGQDFAKARKFLLVFGSMFFVCGVMNAVGAVLHHAVPLIEPVMSEGDVSNRPESAQLDLWEMMLTKLFPWVLVWQFANLSAALFGIGIFLTMIYTIDYHLNKKHTVRKNESGNEKPAFPKFHYLKNSLIVLAVITVLLHGAYRFQRIFEFRNIISERTNFKIGGADFNLAKLDLDQFGWIWTATAATIIMFSAFLINALTSLYMFSMALINVKWSGHVDFGGIRTSSIRAFGAWLLLIGGLVQIIWSGNCGNNIPNECPFPVWFNHNAWYHLLQGGGMTFWFLAEWTYFKSNPFNSKSD